MTPELQDKLYAKYPLIFRQKDLDMKQTCMCWGFECGDGWYMLIDELCSQIQHHVEYKRRPSWRQPLKQLLKTYWEHLRNGGSPLWLPKRLWRRRQRRAQDIPDFRCEASQVKEKFGGLRFYIDGGDDYIEGAVSLAEDLSYRICETCGSTKDMGRTQVYIKTLCRECGEKDRLEWKAYKKEE